MIQFSKFLQLSYWFSSTVQDFHWFYPVIISFGVLILVALIIQLVLKRVDFEDKNLRKILRELPTPLSVFGIIGLILSFFRYEQVRFLGMRFLFLALFIAFIVWVVYSVFKFKVLYPKIDHEYKKQQFVDKYRPKAKPRKHTFKKK